MKRYRLELFQTNDYEAIERHLAKMAKKGWFLESIGTFLWTYRKGEPQDLTYEVTYFSEASDFNPYPTDNQEAYYEYCEAAGWNLVASKDKLQIFSTTKNNPTPIESDEALKFQSIHKSMKKSLFLTSGLLVLLSLPFMIISLIILIKDPIIYFVGNSFYTSIYLVIILLAALYLLIDYGYWYYGTKKALALGNKYKRNHHKVRRIAAIMMIVLPVVFTAATIIGSEPKSYWWVSAIVMIAFILVGLIFRKIKDKMKIAGVSAKVNVLVTTGGIIITVVICTIFMLWSIISLIQNGAFNRQADSSYTFTDSYGEEGAFEIYKDSLPLTLEDLYIIIDSKDYSYEIEEKDNFALSYIRGNQKAPVYFKNSPSLYYEIYKIKLPSLYDTFKKDLIEKYKLSEEHAFKLIRDSRWGAEEVYQLRVNESFYDAYIISHESKLIFLNLGFPPIGEQIEVIREKLIRDKLELKYTLKEGLFANSIKFGEVVQ